MIEKARVSHINAAFEPDGSVSFSGHVIQAMVDEKGNLVAVKPGGGENISFTVAADHPAHGALTSLAAIALQWRSEQIALKRAAAKRVAAEAKELAEAAALRAGALAERAK